METKICSKCGVEKAINVFNTNTHKRRICRTCRSLYYKVWRETHPEYSSIKSKQWAKNNPQRKKEINRLHRTNNPSIYRNINKRAKKKYLFSEKGRETTRAYDKKRRNNPIYRIGNNLSRNMRNSLRNGKCGYHWETLVGYTVENLKQHLESKFLSGMTWDNYGKWHIDHIVPKSFFKYENYTDQEFQYCWSLDNLQPLWAKDNLSKNNKLIGII